MQARNLALFALFVAACQAPPSSVDIGRRGHPIIGGNANLSPYHDAVVSLHQRFGGQAQRGIFCSGTLIAANVVMTAGHCIEGNSNPAGIAVYVGNNAQQDPNPRFFDVVEAVIHPQYRPAPDYDVAYLRLAQPVTGVTPIPPLPAALALGSADEGVLQLEFAGFGRTENGSFDQKLHTTGTLDELGLGGRDRNTQFSYRQGQNGGPCNGDSGGPAFVVRAGTRYLAGVTSYGDPACQDFGVSGRVDTQTDFVAQALGGAVPPPDLNDHAPPTVALLQPTSGATLPENADMQVVATATDDAGLQSVLLHWDFSNETFACPSNGDGVSCSKNGDRHTWSIRVSSGSRSFHVTARDFAGNEVATETRTIQLGAGGGGGGAAPTVSIVSPGAGESLLENSEINITATASDDVGVTDMEIFWEYSNERFSCPANADGVVCTQSGSNYTWTIPVGVGLRPFSVTASDADGNRTTTARQIIVLTDAPSGPAPVEPDPAEPDPAEPDPIVPDPAEPDPTEPDPVVPDPTEPDPAEPDPAEPDPAEPDPAEPDPAEPDPAEPDPAEPDPAQPDPAEPDPAEPDPIVPADPSSFEPNDQLVQASPIVCGDTLNSVLAVEDTDWFRFDDSRNVELEIISDAPMRIAIGTEEAFTIESNDDRLQKTIAFHSEVGQGVRLVADGVANYRITLVCSRGGVQLPKLVQLSCADAEASQVAPFLGGATLLLMAWRRRKRS